MASDPQQHSNENPGQHHEDNLFKRFEDNLPHPTASADHPGNAAGSSLGNDLNNAENSAAAAAGTPQNGNVDSREKAPNSLYKPGAGNAKPDAKKMLADSKSRSKSYRTSGGRRRGILIGFGAGGGLLSIVAGFSALLPLKMPGIMDGIVDDAGKRVEKVVERRAERILLTYMLRGSVAAVKTGNIIVTGNPIGDLFANIRTSNFEKNLKANSGLSFEPGSNKTVRLIHNGQNLGDVKNVDDILKILEKGQDGKSLSRADIRKIVRSEIPAWRFWKRAKFVNWLRIKYDVPRWGTREQEPTEKDEDYEKAVKKEHIERVEAGNIKNMTDFVDCAADSDDCINKTGEGSKLADEVEKGVASATEDLAKEGAKKASSTVIKAVLTKATAAIPVVGAIDLAARVVHRAGEVIEDDLLQKKHAQYIKTSSAVLATTYAGYADQTKAGDNKAEIVGMFSDNFDGWEASATYGIIQSKAVGGPIVGEMLEPMERAQENIPTNAYIDTVKTLFGTVGWIGRAPLEAWYYTVSQVFDAAGDIAGDAVAWIMQFTPAGALLAQLAPLIADVFAGIMKFVGMYVDPLEVGSRLVLFIHQGFLGAFNDKGKEDGMRKLSEAQALIVDQGIRQDHIADMQHESLYDRVLNLDSENSLATALVTTMPSSAAKDPIGSLSAASMRLVASAPNNLARATTANASAATAADTTSEELFGLNAYGGTESDMSAELSDSVKDTNAQCPENSDNAFNHCKIDPQIVTSMNCVFVKCADLYGESAQREGDPLFAYGAEGPKYGPDAVETKPKYGAIAMDWTKTGGMLAALIPIGALEVSRRKL